MNEKNNLIELVINHYNTTKEIAEITIDNELKYAKNNGIEENKHIKTMITIYNKLKTKK